MPERPFDLYRKRIDRSNGKPPESDWATVLDGLTWDYPAELGPLLKALSEWQAESRDARIRLSQRQAVPLPIKLAVMSEGLEISSKDNIAVKQAA